MPDAELIELGKRQAKVEVVIENHDKHLDRLDATTEKLTEISATLKEIVKNHDDKHEKAYDAQRDLEAAHAQNKADIGALETKFEKAIGDLKTEFTKALNDMSAEITRKFSRIDNWKSLLVGGGIILLFILDKWDVISKFFVH